MNNSGRISSKVLAFGEPGNKLKYNGKDEQLLFSTVLQCLEIKAYGLGRTTEEIIYDGELVIKSSKQMNPESAYWNFTRD